ncbi:MAG: amidohydrolase family protein [Sciscionella sp.]
MARFRAFDVHTHRLTADRKSGVESRVGDARQLFGTGETNQTPLEFYRDRRLMAVMFDVDSETTTGLRISNDEIAEEARTSEGQFVGFASVDAWKGAAAVAEVERCTGLGLRGVKIQPITQELYVNDRRFYPLWETCQSLGLPVLIHTGTTAIGNDSPGGRGLHLAYGRPVPAIDDLAADFPRLTIIAAHTGWPWHSELLAVARHKGNVYIDLSGTAPKYFPPEVVTYFNSVMPHKFLFGTDFPLFGPDRWLAEFGRMDLKEHVRKKILYENACGLLNVDTSLFGEG